MSPVAKRETLRAIRNEQNDTGNESEWESDFSTDNSDNDWSGNDCSPWKNFLCKLTKLN